MKISKHLTRLIGESLRARGLFTSPRRKLEAFQDGEDGATAIEFAVLALPFLMLLLAVIEVGIMFFATQVLETGVEGAARLIRTGQAQAFSQAQFKVEVCNRISSMFNCDELKLDARPYAQFGGLDLDKPIDDDGNLAIGGMVFNPGVGGDIIVVRAFYEWPIVASFLGEYFGDLSNGNRLLASTAAFRNEPF